MTRKETLLTQKYELQNELRALRGEELRDITLLTTGYRFYEAVKEAREYSLKQDIENLQKAIEKQKVENEKKTKSEAYFQTEEGIALKAELDAEKQAAADAFHAHENEALSEIKKFVQDNLGKHWTVKFLSDNSLDLAVWDADKADFVFGQTIEIRFEKHSYWNEGREKFETNVGTTGCFDINAQEPGDRARFYIDLGRFLGLDLRWLKKYLFDFADYREEIRNRIRKANARMENPLGL